MFYIVVKKQIIPYLSKFAHLFMRWISYTQSSMSLRFRNLHSRKSWGTTGLTTLCFFVSEGCSRTCGDVGAARQGRCSLPSSPAGRATGRTAPARSTTRSPCCPSARPPPASSASTTSSRPARKSSSSWSSKFLQFLFSSLNREPGKCLLSSHSTRENRIFHPHFLILRLRVFHN